MGARLASGSTVGGPSQFGPQWPIDVNPAIARDIDDEFDGTTLGAKWTQTAESGSATVSVANGLCVYTPPALAGTHANFLTQPIPAGDWTITVAVAHIDSLNVNYNLGAILGLAESSSGTAGKVRSVSMDSFGGSMQVRVYDLTAWGGTPSDVGTLTYQYVYSGYLRIVKSSSTYTWQFSRTGISWFTVQSGTLTFTPGRICIGAHAENGTYAPTAIFKWIRQTA